MCFSLVILHFIEDLGISFEKIHYTLRSMTSGTPCFFDHALWHTVCLPLLSPDVLSPDSGSVATTCSCDPIHSPILQTLPADLHCCFWIPLLHQLPGFKLASTKSNFYHIYLSKLKTHLFKNTSPSLSAALLLRSVNYIPLSLVLLFLLVLAVKIPLSCLEKKKCQLFLLGCIFSKEIHFCEASHISSQLDI